MKLPRGVQEARRGRPWRRYGAPFSISAQTVSTFVHSTPSASAAGAVDNLAIAWELSMSAFLVPLLMITKPGS